MRPVLSPKHNDVQTFHVPGRRKLHRAPEGLSLSIHGRLPSHIWLVQLGRFLQKRIDSIWSNLQQELEEDFSNYQRRETSRGIVSLCLSTRKACSRVTRSSNTLENVQRGWSSTRYSSRPNICPGSTSGWKEWELFLRTCKQKLGASSLEIPNSSTINADGRIFLRRKWEVATYDYLLVHSSYHGLLVVLHAQQHHVVLQSQRRFNF